MQDRVSRLASLDLLRGLAAFTVAIAHYLILGARDWPGFETAAILAVEVFFVLSGFVLAPQLIGCASSTSRRDVGVFLVRRWMRTVPPYLVALVCITVLSGQILSSQFPLYLFYVQNLFWPLPADQDYFAVAWSLSVEEWFYVVFAALTLLVATLRGGTRGLVTAAIAVIVASEAARLLARGAADWDADIRRVTVFRLDSIAFGFLLYLGLGRIERMLDLERRPGVGLLLLLPISALAGLVAWSAVESQSRAAQAVFPYSSALFGAALIVVLHAVRDRFQSGAVAGACFFLGRVSYTVYLFHLIAILLLRPKLAELPLPVQLSVYAVALAAFCAIFFRAFERPILAARPRYRGFREEGIEPPAAMPAPTLPASPTPSTARPARTSGWVPRVVTLLALAGLMVAVRVTFRGDMPVPFYVSLLLTAALANVALVQWGLMRFGPLRVAGLAALLAGAVLPVADLALGRHDPNEVMRPDRAVYSYRDAQRDPDAFRAWWAFVVREWRVGAREAIQAPDPEQRLPFIQVPDSRSRFFSAEIRINNHGFRGADFDADKRGAYRIFVIGESPTFGTMMQPGEKAWPEVLGELLRGRLVCNRPIEVVNAGAVGYGLPDSVERLKRFILPLQPDMVVAYHGWNDAPRIDPSLARLPRPPQWAHRASPLLGEVIHRFALMRYEIAMTEANKMAPETSDEIARTYLDLVALGRKAGFTPVLSTLSTAVTPSSPPEVVAFYGRLFRPIDRLLATVERHNDVVQSIAASEAVPWVDTRPGFTGGWDDGNFIDIVHLTDKGSHRLADRFRRGLTPILEQDPTMRCKAVEDG
jgi:peptidoglycan/LPS O-acetylase OafA/YrhL